MKDQTESFEIRIPRASIACELNALPLESILGRAVKGTAGEGQRALAKLPLSLEGAAVLLRSAWSEAILEEIVDRARLETERAFGKTINLHVPLYVSSACSNRCLYCAPSGTGGRSLSPEAAAREAAVLARLGVRRVVLVAAEAPSVATGDAITRLIESVRPVLAAIDLNVGAADMDDYLHWRAAGAGGVVCFQETYDRRAYAYFHSVGPKSDYDFRLEAPERAARAGMKRLRLGILLGLAEPARDLLSLIVHARLLQERYPDCRIVVGMPRVRRSVPQRFRSWAVNDDELLRYIAVLRLALPRTGIMTSTREPEAMRMKLLSAGVTDLSALAAAGSEAFVECEHDGGDQVRDRRDVPALRSDLERLGYRLT